VWEGTLLAVPFDLGQLEVTGTAVPLLDNVSMNTGRGSAQVGFSQTGTLVYLAGGGAASKVSIIWMDSEGKTEPLLPTPRDYENPSFSPDGKRLAVQINEGSNIDLWVYELERETLSRLTFDEGQDGMPVWTPDGQRVAFTSDRGGVGDHGTSIGSERTARAMRSGLRRAVMISFLIPGPLTARFWPFMN
jgi:dipeptidyl aminopeptidase/acylaminoacyl peptidase